jgi:hypothetical protein
MLIPSGEAGNRSCASASYRSACGIAMNPYESPQLPPDPPPVEPRMFIAWIFWLALAIVVGVTVYDGVIAKLLDWMSHGYV